MTRTLVLVVLATAFAAVPPTDPVAAHHCGGESGIDDQGGSVDYSCHGSTPGLAGGFEAWTASAQWNRFCTYQPERPEDPLLFIDGVSEVRYSPYREMSPERVEELGFDPTGEYREFSAFCHQYPDIVTAFGGFFFYTVTPPIPVEEIRDRVKARIDIPDPPVQTNPSFLDRFTVVRIDTWLWLDPGYWVALDEDETVGSTTVEVFATPNKMQWVFDDGSDSGPCDGPGIPWTRYGPTPECSVVFKRSSAGQPNDAYPGTATVDWIFTWSLNGTDQGPFDAPFLAETDFEIQVGEIQAVGN